MKNYMVKASWEYTDGTTDFDTFYVEAEDSDDAKVFAEWEQPENVQQFFIDEVWERVQ